MCYVWSLQGRTFKSVINNRRKKVVYKMFFSPSIHLFPFIRGWVEGGDSLNREAHSSVLHLQLIRWKDILFQCELEATTWTRQHNHIICKEQKKDPEATKVEAFCHFAPPRNGDKGQPWASPTPAGNEAELLPATQPKVMNVSSIQQVNYGGAQRSALLPHRKRILDNCRHFCVDLLPWVST